MRTLCIEYSEYVSGIRYFLLKSYKVCYYLGDMFTSVWERISACPSVFQLVAHIVLHGFLYSSIFKNCKTKLLINILELIYSKFKLFIIRSIRTKYAYTRIWLWNENVKTDFLIAFLLCSLLERWTVLSIFWISSSSLLCFCNNSW